MNLVHRHIFASVVLTCGAAVGLFAFVLMLGNALRDLLPLIVAGQLALDTSARLVALLIPFVVSYALPMGTLTGILLVLGRMSSDREITALRASGLSVAWLSALIGVVLCIAINFEFMPVARVAYHREMAAAVRQNPLSMIVPKTFTRDFKGYVIYVGDKRGNLMTDFWMWEQDDQKRVTRFVRAESGRLEFDEAKNQLVLTLEHARAEPRDRKDPENFSAAFSSAAWDRATIDIPLEKLLGRQAINVKTKWLTFGELLAEWRRLGRPDPAVSPDERAKQQMRVQITIHEKFATAFSVLSFALVAVPLGIKVSRKETSANLFIGLILALGYYFVSIAAGWFDNRPEMRPDLLMWLPNIAFQSLGLWMFYRVDRS